MSSDAPKRAATMHDVAHLAGVSLKTVSNVINDYPHVRPKTRDRVKDAIAKLDYRVNFTARNLRRGRTGLIGLAIPELRESYFGELANAFAELAGQRKLGVIIEPTRADVESELDVLTNDRRTLTDGLVFEPLLLDVKDLRSAVQSPTVLLGERVYGVGLDHVTMANIDGVRAATKHLFQRGSRRIAVLGGGSGAFVRNRLWDVPESDLTDELTTTTEELRTEGYRRGMAEVGLPLEADLLLRTGPWRRATGAQAIAAALDRGVEFDGVVGLNDTVTLGALHELLVRGIRIPEDVQVIGFDDLDESAYATPALTTIAPGRAALVRVTLDLLIDRLDGSTEPPRLHILPFELIERASTRA